MIDAATGAIAKTRTPKPSAAKLRVVMLILPPPGGIAYYGALLANAMSRFASVRAIICEEMKAFTFAKELEVVAIHKRKIFSLPHPASYCRVLQLAEAHEPDLIHDAAGTGFRWAFGLWPLLARRWPLLMTEHNPQPLAAMGGLYTQLTLRLAWRHAHRFIVHGATCRQALLQAGIAAQKISVNRHGSFAAFDHRRYLELQEEEHTVLFFGELRPNKGIFRLEQLARRVRRLVPEAKFLVAGKCTRLPLHKDMIRVRQAVEELKNASGFEVHEGYVPDERVEYFFRRSAVVILPYEEASQSGVIPLAYAFRKPVVAYDVGDLRENIVAGETGLLVPAGEEENFAAAVTQLLQDKALRRDMGQRAHEWAEQELSWDNIARRTLQDYHHLLQERGPLWRPSLKCHSGRNFPCTGHTSMN
jgi:glycosyltransferase involved in cell wall biosynthesis